MLGGIKQSNMMLKSIVIFSDFPEKKQKLVFLKFGVDVGRLFSSNIPCFLSNKSCFSMGNWTPKNLGKTWGKVVDLGTRGTQRGHGSSVPSLGSLAG